MSMASPRSPLNCQILGRYLPLSPNSQQSRSDTAYLSSRSTPGIDPTEIQSYGRHDRQSYYQSPPDSYTDQDDPNEQVLSLRPRDPTYYLAASHSPEESIKSLSSQRQAEYDVAMYGQGSANLADPYNSPEASNLALGSPGVARRAKAHVPSACVNCKRKHLACETRRPCNRCLQAGKEATCVDVQHKKRGRPRLRDEDHCRGVSSTGDYSHPHLYPAQSDLLAPNQAHPDQYRSGASYRELRPHVDSYARDAQIGHAAPNPDPRQAYSGQPHPSDTCYGPKLIRDLSEVNATALLTVDFVIVRSNESFRNALSLRSNAEDKRLKDLVLPSEKEKIQRLQGSLQSEMRSAGQAPFYQTSGDLYESIASFQSRSEYWTFRLPNGQSRGYPVSVSLARTDSFFVVLTLVSNVNQAAPTTLNNVPQSLWGTPTSSLTPPQPGYNDHPFDSRTYQSYISNSANELLQPSRAESSQYRQRSPSNPQGSGYSPSTGSSGTRSSLGASDVPTENLRHLQLPPIRVSETSAPRGKDRREEKTKSSSKQGQASPGTDKRKKRRKVEIGDILR